MRVRGVRAIPGLTIQAWGTLCLWRVGFARGNRRSFGRLSDLRMTEFEAGLGLWFPALTKLGRGTQICGGLSFEMQVPIRLRSLRDLRSGQAFDFGRRAGAATSAQDDRA